ncbi:MAG: hypothetical protein ACYCS8_13415 [Acidithiobacillus sp.]|nr:hypothetical protein [Acidithiobacillus ferridurans]
MNAIDLQRPELLPEALRVRLQSIESLCRNEEFSENLVRHQKVRNIVIELDSYCMDSRVLGIHYTRAIRADIEHKPMASPALFEPQYALYTVHKMVVF